jgi:hypothetical protein
VQEHRLRYTAVTPRKSHSKAMLQLVGGVAALGPTEIAN